MNTKITILPPRAVEGLEEKYSAVGTGKARGLQPKHLFPNTQPDWRMRVVKPAAFLAMLNQHNTLCVVGLKTFLGALV